MAIEISWFFPLNMMDFKSQIFCERPEGKPFNMGGSFHNYVKVYYGIITPVAPGSLYLLSSGLEGAIRSYK